jgi:hypothetical protein
LEKKSFQNNNLGKHQKERDEKLEDFLKQKACQCMDMTKLVSLTTRTTLHFFHKKNVKKHF